MLIKNSPYVHCLNQSLMLSLWECQFKNRKYKREFLDIITRGFQQHNLVLWDLNIDLISSSVPLLPRLLKSILKLLKTLGYLIHSRIERSEFLPQTCVVTWDICHLVSSIQKISIVQWNTGRWCYRNWSPQNTQACQLVDLLQSVALRICLNKKMLKRWLCEGKFCLTRLEERISIVYGSKRFDNK